MTMLEKVRSGEVDTPEEVAKAINKLIDEINKNEEYNADVEKGNAEIDSFNEEVMKGAKDA